MLSQSHMCDLVKIPALFNPTVETFVSKLLPLLPNTQQVSAISGNDETLRLCKTSMFDSYNIVTW